MTTNNHHAGSNEPVPQDEYRHHAHHPYWKRAHRDWRVWCVAVLMIALMFVYLLTDNLSFRPGKHVHQPVPVIALP